MNFLSFDHSFPEVFSLEESKESVEHVVKSFSNSFPDLQFPLHIKTAMYYEVSYNSIK